MEIYVISKGGYKALSDAESEVAEWFCAQRKSKRDTLYINYC